VRVLALWVDAFDLVSGGDGEQCRLPAIDIRSGNLPFVGWLAHDSFAP